MGVVLPDLSPVGTLTFPPEVLESNEALRAHMDLYFYTPLDPYYKSQAIICTVFMTIAGILNGGIITKRLLEKSLWLFRIQQTRHGKLLALNSVVSFLVIEASFIVLWVVYIWVAAPPAHLADLRYRNYWQSLVYLSLWCGAWASGWGTLFLAPSSLSTATANIFANGTACNSILIGFPTLVTAGMIYLTVVGGGSFFDAATMWQTFDRNIASQNPSGAVSEATSRAAMDVWHQLCVAMRWTAISYTTWSSLSLLLLIFYGGIAGVLLILIRRQIYEQIGLMNAVRGRSADILAVSTWQATITAAAMVEEESRAVASTFFPPIKQAQPRIDASSTPNARVQVLKSAYNLILILYASVCCALVALSGCALYMSTIYPQSQRDPIAMGQVWSRAHIFSMWVINIAGAFILIAIASKTFESYVPNVDKASQRSHKLTGSRLGRKAARLFHLSSKSRRSVSHADAPSSEGGSISLLPPMQDHHSPQQLQQLSGTTSTSSPPATISPSSFSSPARAKRKGASFLALDSMAETQHDYEENDNEGTPYSLGTSTQSTQWRDEVRMDRNPPDMRWISRSPESLLPPPRPMKRAPTLVGHSPAETMSTSSQTRSVRAVNEMNSGTEPVSSSPGASHPEFLPLSLQPSPRSQFRI